MKSIYKINLVLVTLLLLGCGSSGSDESIITSSNNSKLVGSWLLTHPNECQETTTYLANGKWTNIALDEVQTGSYELTSIAESDRYRLAMTVEGDNGLADCNGNSEIDTGRSATFFALFPSDTSLEIYLSESAPLPFFSFKSEYESYLLNKEGLL